MGRLTDSIDSRVVVTLSTLAGGRTLTIPQQHREISALSRLIGPALAALLVDSFGGERLYVPRGPSPHNGRGKAIDCSVVSHLIEKGWSNDRIASTLDCTARTISYKRAYLRQSKER